MIVPAISLAWMTGNIRILGRDARVSMQYNVTALIDRAIGAHQKGNLPLADIICHHLVDNGVKVSVVFDLLGSIAVDVGMHDSALRYFDRSLELDSSRRSVVERRQKTIDILNKEKPQQDCEKSYLLIKAWGFGFWSDLDHVLGQLLLAEITGRIPVVHWSGASLFSDESDGNAFEFFFDPLSPFTIADLISPDFSYFPGKWSAENLRRDDLDKFYGPHSRMTGLYFLDRPETVVVSDFHTYVNDLRRWIPPGHQLHGQDAASIYRYLFAKYLRLKSEITDEIRSFRDANLADNDYVAIHMRGSDKQQESSDNAEINASYHEALARFLESEPSLSIFLLTDFEPFLHEYRERYPGKVVSTQCARTSGTEGVHHLFQDSRVRNGIEVVKDAYLAAGCKYFIGNGRSNVSTSILHLKDWSEENYCLLAGNALYEPNLYLHDW